MAYNVNRQSAHGNYGHAQQPSSYGEEYSVLPPLSVADTLLLHAKFVRQGLLDGLKARACFDTLVTNKVVQATTLKSSLLQGVVLVSALAIKPLLTRSGQGENGLASILFHVLWLYPLTAASLYYAGVFRATEERHGSGTSSGVGGSSGEKSYRAMMAKGVTESYRALILLNYLVVMLAIKQVPYLGIVGFTYASIVDAYYVYEASWIKQGLSLSERVQALDSRWSYFFGFGLPITFVSYWSNDPIVNLALFSLAFPLAQITASSSIPQPLDPKIPTSSLSLSFLPQAQGSFALSNAEGGEEARGRRGNPYVPIRIPVLFLADKLYALLNKNLGSKKKDAGGGGGGGAYGGNGYGVVNGHGHGNGRVVGGMGRQPPMASTAPATRYHAPPPLSSATPPRRGHTMTESSVGVGMGGMPLAGVQGVGMEPRREFEDRKLDSLISAAARRKKGD